LPSARDIADANPVALHNLAGTEQAGSSYFARNVHDRPAVTPAPAPDLDVVGILSAVQETIYTWDIASDRIEWASNARHVLGLRSIESIGTGSAFQFLMAPEHIQRRIDALTNLSTARDGDTAEFRVQYRFTPGGRRSDSSLWLEDHGQCTFDASNTLLSVRGVIRVINERYWEEQRLLHRSDHDELTGQLNRIRLMEALDAVLSRAGRTKQSCCFLMASVDNLATINDSFGFEIGDEVIASVARVVKSRLRGGDSMGRYSSNKFGIILNECGPGAMRVAAERFVKAVRDHPHGRLPAVGDDLDRRRPAARPGLDRPTGPRSRPPGPRPRETAPPRRVHRLRAERRQRIGSPAQHLDRR
jgi:GGDEF domain-containing protein